MNFYNTLLVIVTVICSEFLKHTLSNCDSEFAVNFLNTFLVIVTVNSGEFLKHTLGNWDGELW